MTALEIAGCIAWLVAVCAIVDVILSASHRPRPDADGRSADQVARLRELEGSALHPETGVPADE